MPQEEAKNNLDNLSKSQIRIARIKALKMELDYKAELAYAREEGYKKGFEIGYKEGFEIGFKEGFEIGFKEGFRESFEKEKKKAIENRKRFYVTNLKSMGMPIETIMQATDLTREEVEIYLK